MCFKRSKRDRKKEIEKPHMKIKSKTTVNIEFNEFFISFHLIDGLARNFITFQFNKKKNYNNVYIVAELKNYRSQNANAEVKARVKIVVPMNVWLKSILWLPPHFAHILHHHILVHCVHTTYTHHNKFLTSIYWHFFSAAVAATFYSIIIENCMKKKKKSSKLGKNSSIAHFFFIDFQIIFKFFSSPNILLIGMLWFY